MKQTKARIKRKIKVTADSIADKMGKAMAESYDKFLMQSLLSTSLVHESLFGKIVGYRNVKVPRYLTIKVPVIARDYDNDSEYGTGEFRGWLVSFKVINVCKIGTRTEKEAIYKKEKTGQTIRFSRYNPLTTI